MANNEFPGAGSSSMSSVLSPRGKVKRELLSDVVGGCSYRINNHLDLEYSPLPVNKIISSAEEMVGKEMEYGILNRKREHFVNDLRYGKANSRKDGPPPLRSTLKAAPDALCAVRKVWANPAP
ncbi:retinoic acid receptor responder protein 3-like [Myotis lucifugus]|uniref:retinoic acid receptor responder protein 3-like n=1 Tax=Myotis lucifugus TaxID=59463 RepID=UPI000CCC9918|nr:retinoic acid receptor responder protein 3-like [Myotis lucifugus]